MTIVQATSIDEELPDPLTLEAALSYQSNEHPLITSKQSALNSAKESMTLTDSTNDLDVRAKLQARYVEPADAFQHLGREDHFAKLVASKTLYDFGRTSNLVKSAGQRIGIAEIELDQSKQLRRIEIMQAFFDVILSDLQYNYDNEAMAIYFIQYDRARERHELGQLSEIDVLQKQSEYMEVRRNRFRSEALQRTTRLKMSEVLGQPSQLVSRFTPPKLEYSHYKLLDVSVLQNHAVQHNLTLKKMRLQQAQLRDSIESLRANRLPIVSAQAEAGLYTRELGSYDKWRIGLGIDIPLYQGGRVSKAIGVQHEQLQQLNADIYHQELVLKQEILKLWLDIDVLQKQKESSDTGLDYRELYLDKARSLYEMEVKSDLGDSMVALTAAAKYQAETEFEIAINWEKLRLLSQIPLEEMRK